MTDEYLEAQSAELKRVSSEEAATWLMDQYPVNNPDYGRALLLLRSRSWKRTDQIRLARYYFQKIPFASSRPYEVFATFMSIQQLTKAIKENMPTSEADLDLLRYHLEPVLRKSCKSSSDQEIVRSLLSEMN